MVKVISSNNYASRRYEMHPLRLPPPTNRRSSEVIQAGTRKPIARRTAVIEQRLSLLQMNDRSGLLPCIA
jgi:hypothetical protein